MTLHSHGGDCAVAVKEKNPLKNYAISALFVCKISEKSVVVCRRMFVEVSSANNFGGRTIAKCRLQIS